MPPMHQRTQEQIGLEDFLAGRRDTDAALVWMAREQQLEADGRKFDIAPLPHEVRDFGLLAPALGAVALTES